MAYTTFQRSVMRENLRILNQQYTIKNYIQETEEYTKNDAINKILRTRQLFKEALLKHKGPPIIPTIFKNNPNRYEFVTSREWALQSVRSSKNPPELPFYLFTFSDEIFLNIICNLRPNACKAYLNHGVDNTRFIFLNKDSCGEMAFEEMLSQHPYFYSEDEEIVQKSSHVDLTFLKDLTSHDIPDMEFCCNTGASYFIVDFSIIFPEVKVSTAWVYCMICGGLLETVLFDKTIQVVQEEILYNISQVHVQPSEKDSACVVIRLPIRSVNIQGCSFVEGLLGVTPLTKGNPVKPSIFVRTRLFFFCNSNSGISELVHHTRNQDSTHLEI